MEIQPIQGSVRETDQDFLEQIVLLEKMIRSIRTQAEFVEQMLMGLREELAARSSVGTGESTRDWTILPGWFPPGDGKEM